MAYIHVYQGASITSGGTDGTQVSEGDSTSPISCVLNASNNEISSNIKLALRCETGYLTVGDLIITPTGDSASKWALSLDGITFEAYGDPLTITSVIDATNTIFYVKARATSDETPVNDVSTDLIVSCIIGAV